MCVTPDDIEKLKEIDARIELREEIIAEMEEERIDEKRDEEINKMKQQISFNTYCISLLFCVVILLAFATISYSISCTKLSNHIKYNNRLGKSITGNSYEPRPMPLTIPNTIQKWIERKNK